MIMGAGNWERPIETEIRSGIRRGILVHLKIKMPERRKRKYERNAVWQNSANF